MMLKASQPFAGGCSRNRHGNDDSAWPSSCAPLAPVLFKPERHASNITFTGHGVHARMTYDLSTTGTMKAMMEMSQDGEQWNVLFDAVYNRT
jgi:hypothetical protein